MKFTKKEEIANRIKHVMFAAINGERQLKRAVVLVDSEPEKKEILSCIDTTLKERFPKHKINIFRIDLEEIGSMSNLSHLVFQKIYECLPEETKLVYDFNAWIEKLRNETGFVAPGIRVDFGDNKEEATNGYGLFVFDNLDKANEGVLDGVKEMYHNGRQCIIPLGWEFISFCRHDARIFDVRLNISSAALPYSVDL